MGKIEREIKILNINVNEIKSILEKKGIKSKGKYIQDVYTYDLPSVVELYKKYVEILMNNNDKREILKLINEIKPCFDKKDIEVIDKLLNVKDIIDFIENPDSDYCKLLNEELIKVIVKANENFSKWIRLRRTGDKTTITIKRVVNGKGEYALDAVNELEIDVPSIEDGKQLLSDLGYFFARHQTKMRIAYDYKNTEIVIDKWPKLAPYIEIEGPTKEDIDDAVLMLGYEPKDTIIINTDDVYKQIGIDIYSEEYSNLSFTESEEEEVQAYME